MLFAKKISRRGFTLIELLVVIVVIAVLAAIIIPKFTDQGKRSKEAALKSNLHLIRNALATCQADTGLWVGSLSDLQSTIAPAAKGYDSLGAQVNFAGSAWHGPYVLGTLPNDPVSGAAFAYNPAGGVVLSSSTGNDSAGAAYSTY